MRRRVSLFCVLALGILCLPAIVFAAPLVDLTGTRSSSDTGEIIACCDWDDGAFNLTWEITNSLAVPGWLHYKYTFTISAPEGEQEKNLSHWLMEVSSNFLIAENLLNPQGMTDDGGGQNSFGPSTSNPGIPGSIFAIKWDPIADEPTVTLEFDSNRAPMWGDFYAKDGADSTPGSDAENYAYNAGFGTDPTEGTTNFDAWIAVPNTVVVPEPASILGLGTVLLLLGYRFRRRRM